MYLCGDDGKKDTPVPMPNTAVKLLSADGSWTFGPVRVGRCRAGYIFSNWRFSSAGRASALQAEGQRFDPVNLHHDSLAQSVEQLTFNQWVTGSNPVRVIRMRVWRNWQTHQI